MHSPRFLRITSIVILLNPLAKDTLMLGYNEEVETLGEELLVSREDTRQTVSSPAWLRSLCLGMNVHGMCECGMRKSTMSWPTFTVVYPSTTDRERQYPNLSTTLHNVSQCFHSFGRNCCALRGEETPVQETLP